MSKLDKLVKLATEHLDANEKVVASVMGAYETKSLGANTVKNGVFLATEKRIFFYGKRTFGFDTEYFPYENVSSIEMSKSLMGHTISFFASGNKVKMKWINMGDLNLFIEQIKNNIGKKTNSPINETRSSITVADEIQKLAELLSQGILTEEEFSSKKKQLLGI